MHHSPLLSFSFSSWQVVECPFIGAAHCPFPTFLAPALLLNLSGSSHVSSVCQLTRKASSLSARCIGVRPSESVCECDPVNNQQSTNQCPAVEEFAFTSPCESVGACQSASRVERIGFETVLHQSTPTWSSPFIEDSEPMAETIRCEANNL